MKIKVFGMDLCESVDKTVEHGGVEARAEYLRDPLGGDWPTPHEERLDVWTVLALSVFAALFERPRVDFSDESGDGDAVRRVVAALSHGLAVSSRECDPTTEWLRTYPIVEEGSVGPVEADDFA